MSCNYDTTIYLGINNISEQQLQLSPNPVTQNQFTVTLAELPKPNTTFMLYNALGQMVKQEELTTVTQQVSTQGLANGIYTYAIVTNKGKTGSGKLVVAK